MKVRQGFISNSSSTSFCICGYYIDNTDILDDLELTKDIKTYYYPYDNTGYIGIDIDDMQDNETLSEFKQRCKEKINKIFPCENSISIITNGWYDG